jgi:hypothetical protein
MQQIVVRANHQKNTFTIRKDGSKFRTEKMSKEEFNNSLYNTSDDWKNYLRNSQSYKLIK